jgi:endoglucanase
MAETQTSISFTGLILRRCQLFTYLFLLSISISACGGGSSDAPKNDPVVSVPVIVPIPIAPVKNPPTTMLKTVGMQWQSADGKQKLLKGVNLGNWLMQEFWMMGQGSNGIDDQCKLEATLDQRFGYVERQRLYRLFRQNWIGNRDWDMIEKFGFNVVRLPFIWSLIEDEKNPMHLRPDAWEMMDDALAQAEQRGIYVILDLHGAVGAQGWEHHSGCAGKNLYWSTPTFQERTTWLWTQIAARYKDRTVVAGYSLLNEPWGTSEANLAIEVKKLYEAVRSVDKNHVVILPGHSSGINAYGKPAEKGMSNVAFEMHFYPGLFGWGQIGLDVHKDWLYCGSSGNGGVCEWNNRLKELNAAFLVGEFQPWTGQGLEQGAQITRVTYDVYANLGWAATSWSYKLITNSGGQGAGTWGLVTNAGNNSVPAVNFSTASLTEIETLFQQFGTVPYEPHQALMAWLNSSVAPNPFNRPK